MVLPDLFVLPADNFSPLLRGRPRLRVSPARRRQPLPDRLHRAAGPEQRADGRQPAGGLRPAVGRVLDRPGWHFRRPGMKEEMKK